MAEMSLEEAPRRAREHFEKGMAALERGNYDYAMDMFEVALDYAPRLLKARRYLRAANNKKLRGAKSNSLTKLMSQLGGLPGAMQVSAQIKKKPDEAMKNAEKLLRKDPMNLQFINLFCQAAKAADMPEAAIMTMEVARENNPQDDKLVEQLAIMYRESNLMHDARLAYEDLVRLRPADGDAVRALKDATALDTMQKGGWGEATSYRDLIKDTKEATQLEQQNKAVKTDSDVDALIKDTLAKVQREPQNMNYRRALAELYARSGELDKALAALEEANTMTGGADPQIDKAISQTKVHILDARMAAAETAGDANAVAALKKERDDFLLADTEDKVRRYPNDLQFRYDLGVIYYELGRLNDAIQQLQLGQRNPQRRIRALYYMALCFKAKQQLDIAREQLEKAITELPTMDDTKKDILYELGSLTETMGDKARAVEYFKQIYAVDIGYRDIADKIEKSYAK